MSALPVESSNFVGFIPTKPHCEVDKVVRRGCGPLLLGRVNGKTALIRPRCNSRRCTVCQPRVIESKMERIPVMTELYGAEMSRHEWECVRAQLARQRKKGNAASYVCVPTDYDRVFVASDAHIGDPTTLLAVEDAMFASRSEWGCIVFSRSWSSPVEPVEHSPDLHIDGIVTASLEWIEGQAKRLGLAKQERSTSICYFTTEDEHAAMILIAGVGARFEHPESRVLAPHPWRRTA